MGQCSDDYIDSVTEPGWDEPEDYTPSSIPPTEAKHKLCPHCENQTTRMATLGGTMDMCPECGPVGDGIDPPTCMECGRVNCDDSPPCIFCGACNYADRHEGFCSERCRQAAREYDA